MTTIELFAAAFGILGNALLAYKGKHAGWGFVAFLASNAGWIAFALQHDHLGLLAQQLCFTATSLLGIYHWLVKPRLAPERDDDSRETMFGPGDLYTDLLAANARIAELERHLEACTKAPHGASGGQS